MAPEIFYQNFFSGIFVPKMVKTPILEKWHLNQNFCLAFLCPKWQKAPGPILEKWHFYQNFLSGIFVPKMVKSTHSRKMAFLPEILGILSGIFVPKMLKKVAKFLKLICDFKLRLL